jgi:hypothetical protein
MTIPVVLITGALTGIGRATALAFAQEGARIVVSGRRDQEGQALTLELRALGVEAEFIRADVRHEDEVRNLVDKTVARFGRLDVAVNNAGTEGKPGPVTEQTTESYAATFDTNVLGVLLSMKHEMRVMQAQGSGSIVNLSSTMGHRGAPGASLHTASKHAVEGLTKSAVYGDSGDFRHLSDRRCRHAARLRRHFRSNRPSRNNVGGPPGFARRRAVVCGRAGRVVGIRGAGPYGRRRRTGGEPLDRRDPGVHEPRTREERGLGHDGGAGNWLRHGFAARRRLDAIRAMADPPLLLGACGLPHRPSDRDVALAASYARR